MAEPSAHINYSFEDIQRYLQGNMSAQEMHDMEKAALQDPFLADAIEGYTEVNPVVAQQHLNEINAALLNKKDETKIVAISRNTQWLRIAAIIIVAAGIGIAGRYIFKKSTKEEQVVASQQEVKNTPAIKSATDSVKEITSTPHDSETAFAENKTAGNSRVLSKTDGNHPSLLRNKIAEDNSAGTTAAINATSQMREDKNRIKSFPAPSARETIDSVHFSMKSKASEVAIAANTFSGKVMDENNKPIPYVAIETLDKQKETFADSAGNFTLMEQDSAIHITASTMGYETKNVRLESNSKNKIVLRNARSPLEEVVVVGYGGTKKSSEEAVPVGGWKKFNNYVLTVLNKDSSENYNTNNLVELEFLINNDGSPSHFKIVRSPDDEKSSKAIDIVKSGPKWTTPSKKKKARVRINF